MKLENELYKNILMLKKYFITFIITFANIQKNEASKCKDDILGPLNDQTCACCLNFEVAKDNASNIDNQFEETKKKLESANVELGNTKVELGETKKEVESTKTELRETIIRLESTRGQWEETKKELESTKNELKSTKEKLDSTEGYLRSIKKQLEETEKKLEATEEQMGETKTGAEVVFNHLENNNKNQEKIKKLEEELEKIKKENSELKKLEEEQKVAIMRLEKEILENNKKITENDKINLEYNNAFKEKEEELDRLISENKENQEKIKGLMFENNNLEERLKNASSNTDVKDLQKFRAEDDKKASLGIIDIFNGRISEPIEDKCIFYLPFKFFEDDIVIEDISKKINNNTIKKDIKRDYIKKKERRDSSSFKTSQHQSSYSKDCFTTPTIINKFAGVFKNMDKNTSEGKDPDQELNFFHKDYLAANSANPGGYSNLTIDLLTKYIFSQSSIEKREEQPCINIKTLKKLYLVAKGGNYVSGEKNIDKKEDKKNLKNDIIKKSDKKGNRKENGEKKEVNEKKKLALNIVNRNGFGKVFFKENVFYNGKNHEIKVEDVKVMNLNDDFLGEINLNYGDFVNFCSVDEYVSSEKQGKKEFFLLQLDLSDPECIALLEQVGRGNYGVVKKGLILENNKFVPKAIKFTCTNDEFETSKEENIKKEILAGRVAKLMGTENIAYIQDYMTIENFITRNNKRKEELTGKLKDAWKECLSQEKYEKFQEDRQNIKQCFVNNVFKNNEKIGNKLYVMIMDLINGEDLFKWEEDVNIDKLGDTLFGVLRRGYILKVALKDIKAKNIMYDDEKDKFTIIDIQTLGKVNGNLTDSFGTPEYWPFFKTLNINFEKLKKEKEIEENDLFIRYCNVIDSNFVDIYSACMTMYFSKFKTLTAAGLLTLLLKWIVLDKENEKNKNWRNFSIEDKIKFLKNYSKKYKTYIGNKGEDVKVKKNLNKTFAEEDIIVEDFVTPDIKFFFENIDDRNLNDTQKARLAEYLYQFIDGNNNIFMLEDIKKGIKKQKNTLDNKEKIAEFFNKCIVRDFNNFETLKNDKSEYADTIKYVLCFGSCLNYSSSKNKPNVTNILGSIKLNEKIEEEDKEFFEDNNKISSVIEELKKGFNQEFVSELLKILSLKEYSKVNNASLIDVDFCLKDKDNKEMKKKVFYLLKHLENEKLLFVPRDLVKIYEMINSSEIKK